MLAEIIGTFTVLFLLFLIRNYYILPSRAMKKYADAIRSMGYNVLLIPYNPFYNRIHQITFKYVPQGDPLKLLRQEYPKYDVIVTNMITKPFLQFCHPDFIKDFYTGDKEFIYYKTSMIRNFMQRVTGVTLGGSQGHDWKRKRTALNSVFNFDFVKSNIPTIVEICDKQINKIEELYVVSNQNGQKIVNYHILQLGINIFSKVILTAFLGYTKDEKIEGVSVAMFLKTLMDDSLINGIDFVSMVLGEGFKKLGIRKIDQDINRRIKLYKAWALGYIRARTKQIEQKIKVSPPNQKKITDCLKALIVQKHSGKFSEDEQIASEHQLLSIFGGFFFSGTDTTANYLQMMIYYTVSNPECEKILRTEIDTYMKNDDFSFENLKNFKYIDNIQKETTRMYGPVNTLFPRQAQEDNYMNGLFVKKGTVAYPVNFGNHHSEKYFIKPLQFRPDRWDSQCNQLPPFVMGGFNAGPRTCIGKHLAMIESKIALIKFFRRYKNIELPKKNFKMSYKLVVAPQIMKAKLTIRQ